MTSWMTFCSLVEALSVPLLGVSTLAAGKLTVGLAAETAQRWFIAALIAVTLITCHTVATIDPRWLIHTVTLAMMVVGALLLPDRSTLEERRVASASRLTF